MKGSRRIVENIKNVILVVLFLTTILLLYLLWSNNSGSSIDLSELLPFIGREDAAPEISDVILPEYIAFGRGDDRFALEYEKLDTLQQDCVSRLSEIYAGTVQVYTISAEQYRQAMSLYGCAILKWPVNLPYQEFCQYFGIDVPSAEGIAYMNSFGYSDAAKDSVFIFDGINNIYYRLALEGAAFVRPDVSDDIAADSIYYPASAVLGCSSNALIPIAEYSSQRICRYEKESDNENTRAVMAEGAFGVTFDFVRRMTDDFGTVTYMYGYGQKTLTAQRDGSYEYKAEVSGESQGFIGDLNTALKFITQCGGWDEDSQRLSYRLVSIREEGSQRAKSYTFGFAEYIGDNRIYSESGLPLIITVSSGEVSYYFRNAVTLSSTDTGERTPVYEAANVIASNAGHMYKVENDDALSPDTDEAFSVIADAIDSVSMGYFLFSGDDSALPCWVVKLQSGHCFFFDLYEGSPLGFVK